MNKIILLVKTSKACNLLKMDSFKTVQSGNDGSDTPSILAFLVIFCSNFLAKSAHKKPKKSIIYVHQHPRAPKVVRWIVPFKMVILSNTRSSPSMYLDSLFTFLQGKHRQFLKVKRVSGEKNLNRYLVVLFMASS